MTLDDLRSHSELLAPHGCAKSRAVLELFDQLAQRDELLAGLTADYNAMQTRARKLEAAIRLHRDQRADDRCWMDDIALYEALGEGVPIDLSVGNKFKMLKNCLRYIDVRCAEGDWKSYTELEAEIAEKNRLIAMHADIDARNESIIAAKDELIAGLSDRVERQAELLSKRAEKTH